MTSSVYHLTDETLNELLDQALDAGPRAAAESHLAGCRECSARFDSMQTLFARLEALPDLPLERDLSANVVETLRRAAPVTMPAGRRAPGMAGLIFAGQAALAAILLAFAWPVAASIAALLPVPISAPGLAPLFGQLSGLFASLGALIANPLPLWNTLMQQLGTVPAALDGILPAWLNPLQVALVVAAAGGLWLLGNALILTPPLLARLRRNS